MLGWSLKESFIGNNRSKLTPNWSIIIERLVKYRFEKYNWWVEFTTANKTKRSLDFEITKQNRKKKIIKSGIKMLKVRLGGKLCIF